MPDTIAALANVTRILENRFFFKESKVMSEELKRLKHEEETIDALARASGINDTSVLKELVALAIRPETVAALCLVPVIEVAWADGAIDAREIEVFIKGSEKTGFQANMRILREWLLKKPDDALMQAWKQYMKGLCGVMNAKAHEQLCDDILDHAREVAKASGGFMGLVDPVSPEEKRKLEEMRAFLKETRLCG
jgi:tellurite resistance protein